MSNVNEVQNTLRKLQGYRQHPVALYEKLGFSAPSEFECDECSVRLACRFAYAPCNVKGEDCAAVVVSRVPKISPNLRVIDFGKV